MRSLTKLISILFSFSVFANPYPSTWWQEVSRDGAPGWEILPQDAGKGEVILSKRTELGIFSNLSASVFTLDGEIYGSVEGLWQMMKYPDPSDPTDPRHQFQYPFTRDEVKLMSMWDSKNAGNLANKVNHDNNINWISYGNHRFNYVDGGAGSDFHYQLIRRAFIAKANQNPDIKKLLMKTKGLKLKPDHHMRADSPASFKYHELWMDLRDNYFSVVEE
ncbi:MAG: hypothetical protein OHK0056_22310 [Bacteriovoracaceae bacterium]